MGAKYLFRPTLAQLFFLSVLGLALLLAVLFYLLLEGSRASIIQSSEQLRDQASREIALRVKLSLNAAEKAIADVEAQLRRRVVQPTDWPAFEAALYAQLLANENLSELTLTYGDKQGYSSGAIELSSTGRGQFSVFRILEAGGSRILTRHIHLRGQTFVSELRERPVDGGFLSAPLRQETGDAPPDPTAHPTFSTPASEELYGKAIWSDLSWTQPDLRLPVEQRRVGVTVQKTIEGGAGRFVGVLRAGLWTQQLDRIVQLKITEGSEADPHRIFICDTQGRLITRWTPGDTVKEFGDDLRIVPAVLPAELKAALEQPMLRATGADMLSSSTRFTVDGKTFLATYRPLENTRNWVVGILVPEEVYLGKLLQTRQRLLIGSLLVMACIILGGALTLRMVKHDLARATTETSRMRGFDFSPGAGVPRIHDVQAVMDGLERAKAVLRAMSKYAPVALVRQFYQRSIEPALGSDLREVTLMFTDIKDFTTLAERLTPNQLALVLGHYLNAMTHAIHGQKGTIDKFIGDGVMAFWNAPLPSESHARLACQAALDCLRLTKALYQSEAWKDLPPLHTRVGLHMDKVMVGHFGAPDRMNYTAMGDGVNTSSRLESLNKEYGTTILASETVFEAARDAFAFRLVDYVAVKGKRKGLKVYELLETADASRLQTARNYERAFESYLRRDFVGALALFETQSGDSPSSVLAERCRRMIADPPQGDWDGVYVATSK